MSKARTVTLTITAPRMGAVREWLREYGGKAPRDARAALAAYARAVLVSNSDWDGVPLAVALVSAWTPAREKAGGTADVLLCNVRKALLELDAYLAANGGAEYRQAFDATYRDCRKYPASAALPVLVAHIAGCLEVVAAHLELPNDGDGTAEDSLLMLM